MRNLLLLLVFVCVCGSGVSAQPATAEQFAQSCSAFNEKKIYLSAVRNCTRSLELRPNDLKTLQLRAAANSGIKDHWNELQDLNAALKLSPNDKNLIGWRAMRHLAMYEYDAAIADLDRLLAIDPNYAAAFYQRSKIYEMLNKRDLAQKDADKAAQLLPNDTNVKELLRFLASLKVPSSVSGRALEADLDPAAPAGPQLNDVKTMIGKLKSTTLASEAELTAALLFYADTLDPKSPTYKLFRTHNRHRDFFSAIGMCLFRFPANTFCNGLAYDEAVVKVRPPTYEGTVLDQYYKERSMLVWKTLLTLPNLTPRQKFSVLGTQELAFMTVRNYPRSVEAAVKIEALGQDYLGRAYAARARSNRGLKRYDAALADLDRLLALKAAGKTIVWVREYQRAEILNDAGKTAEAIKAADLALKNEPDEWQATMQKARALRLQKKYPLALAEIEKIFAKFPNAMYIRGERALIYRGMGDLQKAYADEAIATRSLQ